MVDLLQNFNHKLHLFLLSVPIIFTQNLDDSNACQGDQGSPVFIQIGTEWTLVGIVSTFANARPNAPCLDGHNTIITQLGGLSSWISKA